MLKLHVTGGGGHSPTMYNAYLANTQFKNRLSKIKPETLLTSCLSDFSYLIVRRVKD